METCLLLEDSGGDGDSKSNYDQAVKLIKSAKKNEKKEKKIKLNQSMKKHLNF